MNFLFFLMREVVFNYLTDHIFQVIVFIWKWDVFMTMTQIGRKKTPECSYYDYLNIILQK